MLLFVSEDHLFPFGYDEVRELSVPNRVIFLLSFQAHNVDQRSDSSLEHITGKLSSLVQMLTKYLQPSPAVDELNVDFLRSRLPPPPRGSGKKEDTDAPSAKRKKTESGKADLGVVDLTNESGVGGKKRCVPCLWRIIQFSIILLCPPS